MVLACSASPDPAWIPYDIGQFTHASVHAPTSHRTHETERTTNTCARPGNTPKCKYHVLNGGNGALHSDGLDLRSPSRNHLRANLRIFNKNEISNSNVDGRKLMLSTTGKYGTDKC